MAKKKTQKTEKSKFQYSKELEGVLLIILSLIGLGSYGVIGSLVKKFAIFLFGSWSFLLLIGGLIIGLYLIINRKKTNLLNARLIGVYTIILAILLFSHLSYIEDNSLTGKEIISTTYSNIASAYDNESEVINTGGGMIGAIFTAGSVKLFDIEGTQIVIIIIAVFGVIMLFDLTLADLFRAIGGAFKKIFGKEHTPKQLTLEEMAQEDEKKPDNRVVITSVEDLKPHTVETNDEVIVNIPSNNVEVDSNYVDTYVKPPVTLLEQVKSKGKVNSNEYVSANTKVLERVFNDFGIRANVVEVHVGPAVTQYELDVQRGTRVSKITSMSREIGLALAAKEVRIEAPIPGKTTVGIEIPNQEIVPVSMREIMEAIPRKYDDSKLLTPLGRDIMGNVKFMEVNKTPHLLVAGATGSGKSVCINNIIISVLMRSTPEEVRMVLVDPKKVEFNVYDGIPHLLTPVVTDPKKASAALQKIVVEMDERYEIFKDSQTKNITTYNEYVDKKLKKDPNCGLKKLPYILVIIDELADLMLVAAKEVEESIMRITQLARAAGIHLIVATQRPSADIITGIIKANIPARISFAVSSSIDSRTILDMTGAEKLLGKGDMLYKPMDDNVPTRIQGSYVSDAEIERVVDFIKKRSNNPRYDERYSNLDKANEESNSTSASNEPKEKDVLYNEILEYAVTKGVISASLIQRRFSIGYNRAARIIDLFEEQGIVGPAKGSKPRDVLVKLENKNGE